MASADVIFMTDAHVEFSEGWDEQVLSQIGPRRILAATITERDEGFRGYGARLLVPLMRTSWNREPVAAPGAVPISVCAGTALTRDLFHKIGGYDPGMLFYGAGEAEFSVRAWLCGAEIHSLPEVEVQHEFKPRPAFLTHMARIRPYWVHNCLRFGLLYLSELGCMQLLRYYARAFPAYFQPALERLEEGDLWARRRQIEQRQERPFAWFVEHFAMKNQMGGEII
jgi:GT2 family glycosyltransferase